MSGKKTDPKINSGRITRKSQIPVVATLTIPTLISNNKRVVETRLAKYNHILLTGQQK
ncbi:hypothetical protein IJ732_08405 [bacterium]|nr:hypothetical protein [bacterium]